MKKIITLLLLLMTMATYGQKVISHAYNFVDKTDIQTKVSETFVVIHIVEIDFKGEQMNITTAKETFQFKIHQETFEVTIIKGEKCPTFYATNIGTNKIGKIALEDNYFFLLEGDYLLKFYN